MATWYEPADTLSEVLALLRLSGTDVDVDTITGLIPAAADTIDAYLDRPVDDPLTGPPPPPAVQRSLEVVTVAMYHRGGVVATVGVGAGFDQRPFDPLGDVYFELSPYKMQWAIA